MPRVSNLDQELFCAEDYEDTPLLAAVKQLCTDTNQTIDFLETLNMGQVVKIARDHYDRELPELWRIWIDWNEGGTSQPMGDL